MATPLDVAANFNGATITEAQQKIWIAALRAALAEMGDPLARYGAIQNLGFSLSVSGNALTIALKTRALADADANNPISAAFRNFTPATGDFSVLNLTAAHSLVVSSGSTLGTRNGIPFRLWFVAFNDAGTWRLGVINCVTTVAGAGAGSDVTKIFPLSAWGIDSSTAEGGAGAADSAQTFYTGTAVTAKAYVVLGYATWETGLATAGTWSSGPTRVQTFGPGVPLPGQTVQVQRTDTGAVTTGTTTVPYDDTIPQSGEGDQYMTVAITPSSSANVLRVRARAIVSCTVGGVISASLYQDATANALHSSIVPYAAATASNEIPVPVEARVLAAGTASTTFKLRAGLNAANTTTFNGHTGTRVYGGALNSYMEVEEQIG